MRALKDVRQILPSNPKNRGKRSLLSLVFGSCLVFGVWCLVFSTGVLAETAPNTLTSAEKKAGWILLFDGKSFDGWRGFKKDKPTDTWSVQDGCLHNAANKKAPGDLITIATYSDFELEWDWRLAPGSNSGLKYYVTEDRPGSAIGHEYQMIDDDHYKAPLKPAQKTGGFYDVLPPTNVHTKPIGEFNHSRILIHGNHIEHWLNGAKTVEYDLGSDATKAAIAKSKFKAIQGFGDKIQGHILLQNHGDEVWFRSIKLRDLSKK